MAGAKRTTSAVIDLTEDNEQTLDNSPTTQKDKDVAILRTLADNGHYEPLVPVISVESVISSSPSPLTEVNVVKIIKRQQPSRPRPSPSPPTVIITSPVSIRTLGNKKPKPPFKPAPQPITIPSDPPPTTFSDKKCPICFDVLKSPSVTLCGHVFCTECLKEVVKTTKQCPICRRKMTSKGFHPLYF